MTRKPCLACGKPKERGIQGAKYCAACRATADSTIARIRERTRVTNGRPRAIALTLVPPSGDRIAWVPVWTPPAWRDDARDLKPTDDTEREAS